MHEIKTANPRTAAILAGAYLENVAQLTLLTRMISLSKENLDRLFYGSAPLAAFSAKTQLLFALGIIGSKIAHDLVVIREIRNAFAHAKISISFETKEIAERISGMHCLSHISDRASLTNQFKFASAVDFLLIHLISRWGAEEGAVNTQITNYDPPAPLLGAPYEEISA